MLVNMCPRQIVKLGDGSCRSADACESWGACAKKTIKHLTCSRKVGPARSRGYIEQAFRRLAVRWELLDGPENAPLLLREQHKLLNSGRSCEGLARGTGPHHSIRAKMEQEASIA